MRNNESIFSVKKKVNHAHISTFLLVWYDQGLTMSSISSYGYRRKEGTGVLMFFSHA